MRKFMVIILLIAFAFNNYGDDNDISLSPLLRTWGLNLLLTYSGIELFPTLRTKLDVMIGGAYETSNYYRNSDDSYYIPSDETDLSKYQQWDFDWALGFRQGLLFNDLKNNNLLELYFRLRGIYDIHLEKDSPANSLIFDSGLRESEGILLNTFISGLFLDNVIQDKDIYTKNGYSCDLSLEYGPEFLLNNLIGYSDFFRLTLDLSGYLVLFKFKKSTDEKFNIFNLYLCDRFVFDWLWGDYIPFIARKTIGGRSFLLNDAIGGAVRGVENCRYDSYLKFINNFDVRMYFPSFSINVVKMTPLLILYFDSGLFDNLDYELVLNNLVFAAGIGTGINISGIDIIVYTSYFINEEKFQVLFMIGLHY